MKGVDMKIGEGNLTFQKTGLAFLALSLVTGLPGAVLKKPAKGSAEASAMNGYGKLPLSFEENRGQTDPQVRYLTRGSGYSLFLTRRDAVLAVSSMDEHRKTQTTAIRMSFADASKAPKISAADLQTGLTNYLIGSNRKDWRIGVQHYGRVRYSGLYPWVDAVFYGNQRQLEYDLVVAPGADPSRIQLQYEGLKNISLDGNGDLVLHLASGDLRQIRPTVYQETGGKRQVIDSSYIIRDGKVGFQIAAYDHRKPLVIDPTLQWSTFLGGSGVDQVTGIAVDAAGSAYAVGYTSSFDFPGSVLPNGFHAADSTMPS